MTDPLILASASPRRRELLGGLGVSFEVVTANVVEFDEESAPQMAPTHLATENARLKAEAVAALMPGRWVLGADTVVFLGERLFGKPASLEQARDYLMALSGRMHEVATAVALLGPNGQRDIQGAVTQVTFRPLSDETITRYLAAVNVLDKAGAYALQEHGDWIIERVEGSRTNVIGLPTELIERVFKQRKLL